MSTKTSILCTTPILQFHTTALTKSVENNPYTELVSVPRNSEKINVNQTMKLMYN